jgi:AraC-like DNA-binding protein
VTADGEPHPLDWFHAPEAEALLARIARAAATPVALHHVQDGGESPRVAACGGCAACRHVSGTAEGRSACRASRTTASARAVRRAGAVPFVCHMGFACVSVRVLPGRGFVLTAGPYVPPGSGESLALDAEAGIAALGMRAEDVPPGWLDDIAIASPRAVAEVAEWGAETLAAGWDAFRDGAAQQPSDAADTPPGDNAPRPKPRRAVSARPHGSDAGAIAAALAAGSIADARDLARSALGEGAQGRRTRDAARARVVGLAASVLEAAEAARMDTGPAWEQFPALLAAPPDASAEAALPALMDVLGTLRPRRTRAAPADGGTRHDALHRLVSEHLEDGITLTEVARALGRSPSAVTRGLQRRYGMSFTEYTNRLRVDRAKELLRRTQLRIGEVARRVGLTDTSNLGRLFRKFEGLSPGEYRNRQRDGR